MDDYFGKAYYYVEADEAGGEASEDRADVDSEGGGVFRGEGGEQAEY